MIDEFGCGPAGSDFHEQIARFTQGSISSLGGALGGAPKSSSRNIFPSPREKVPPGSGGLRGLEKKFPGKRKTFEGSK